jgi:hypothetical protein
MTMRTETIVESRWTTLELSANEQALLEWAGRSLARGTDRFGNAVASSTASLVRVDRIDARLAQVRVADAVGIIAGPTLQLVVRPKIPTAHLLHLFAAADVLPRLDHEQGLAAESDDLAELVCAWFVTATEHVLEEGLARDYRPQRDQLRVVRGRLDSLATARLYYGGRAAVVSEFEEHDFDTPLNRTVMHAARLVVSTPSLPEALRRRALRVTRRMDGVGELTPADRGASVDRRTAYYADALCLARQIIAARGRALEVGDRRSWTFLIRTAGPVEDGLRHAIARSLRGPVQVKRGKLRLGGSTLSVNPDLVFDTGHELRVGDIKYKLTGSEWNRSDLYEIVAFATAYRVERCALISFEIGLTGPLAPLSVGDIVVSDLRWDARATRSPQQAEQQLGTQLRSWLDQRTPPVGKG